MGLNKGGFTLIELVVSTAISALVLSSVGFLYLGTVRLIRQSYGEAVLSIDLRQARERTLFQTKKGDAAVAWGGLLSAGDAVLASKSMTYKSHGVRRADGEREEKAGLKWSGGSIDSSVFATKGLFTITLSREASGEKRTQRIVVPAFGCEQARNVQRIFHDDLLK